MMTLVTLSSLGYMGLKLTGTLPAKSPWRRVVWAVLGVFLFALWASPWIYRSRPDAMTAWSVRLPLWTGYLFMGMAGFFLVFLIGIDLAKGLSGRLAALRGRPGMRGPATKPEAASLSAAGLSRREALQSLLPWGALGTAGALSGFGLHTALAGPKLVDVAVPEPKLHPDLEGLRIVQISDLHVGNTITREYVENVVRIATEAKPDLIALTGDFVDGSVAQLARDIEPLWTLRAPLGVYYVPGNHEYYSGADAWMREFARHGVTVLRNSHTVTQKGGARILIAGVTDPRAGGFSAEDAPDPEKAVRGAPKDADYRIFLAHQPKQYVQAEVAGCDLQLSGHTHAGQFFPFNGIAALVHRYYRGLNRHEDRFWVHVNTGTGYWGPPNRLGIHAEVSLLRLTRNRA